MPLAAPPDHVARVAFLGTPHAAVPSLQALVEAGYHVEVVISQPDRRRGRGSKKIPSPVKAAALELGLEVDDDLARLEDASVDLGVVVAFGRMIPRLLLEQVPMINVHFSLLPRWRGAAPVERAILAGDTTTGVGIMAVAEGLDTGAVFASDEVKIGPHATAVGLTAELADRGAELLVDTLARGLVDGDGAIWAEPQTGTASYAAKLERGERELNFAQSAADLDRRVRVGRAWTWFRQTRLGVDKASLSSYGKADQPPGTLIEVRPDCVVAAAATGCIELLEVKPEGRRSQSVADWVNGSRPRVGECLGGAGEKKS